MQLKLKNFIFFLFLCLQCSWALGQNNPRLFIQKGNQDYNNKNYKSAIENFTKAIEIQETSLVYNQRGRTKRKLNDYNGAVKDFQKAIELNPQSDVAYNNLGLVYRTLKEYNKAVETYNKAIELNPQNALYYFNRGQVKKAQKKYQQAIADTKKALELSPNENTYTYELNGLLQRLSGNTNQVKTPQDDIEILINLLRKKDLENRKLQKDIDRLNKEYLSLSKLAKEKKDKAINEEREKGKKAINEEREKTEKAVKEAKAKNKIELNRKNKEISDYTSQIEEYKRKIREAKEKIEEKNIKVKSKINDVLNKIKNKKLNQSQKDSLAKLIAELEKANRDKSSIQGEIDKLKDLVSGKDSLLNFGRRLIYIFLGVLAFLLVLLTGFFIMACIRKKQRDVLAKKNKEIEQQKVEIETKSKELEFAYNQITDSVLYAQRIQQAILDSPKSIIQKFTDGFIFYIPRDIVSGDFYWFTETEDELILAAVDCTGHGVPGAFMTIMGNSLLDRIVNEQKVTQPSLILKKLDTKIRATLHRKEQEDSMADGMDMVIVNVNSKEKRMSVAGAKNPLYYIQDNEIKQIQGSKYPIGGWISSEEKYFEENIINLNGNESFYIFSDGFQDQFGGEDDKKYMKGKFRRLLLSNNHLPMKEQAEILEKEFKTWKGDTPQTDDVLVIGIRV